MKLNLDLLENVNKYLYPLFYYTYSNNENEIYCNITFKTVYYHYDSFIYYDYVNNTRKFIKEKFIEQLSTHELNFIYTKNIIYANNEERAYKTNPFKISQKDLNYLRSSERLK